MATTTAVPPAGPQVVKRSHGGARAGSGREPKPETVEKRAKVAEATSEEAISSWEWLDAVPKANWGTKLICYAHRTKPLIDLGSGKPVAIEIIAHPFDLTYILKTHGSGGYRFDVSVIPEDGSKQHRIKQFYETVFDMRFPPRIPFGTWLDDARNKDWEWARPALLEEAQRATAAAPAAEQQSPAQTLVDYLDVATKVKELSGGNENPGIASLVFKMLESSQEALRAYQDPTKQAATLKSMIELFGGGQKKEDSSLLLILELMKEQNRDLREELKAMRAQTPTNPLDGVKPVLELLSTLGVNLGGGGGGGRVNTADTVVSTVGDVLSKVIDKASDLAPQIVGAYQHGKNVELQIAREGLKTGKKPWEFQPATTTTPAPAGPPPPAPAPVSEGPMTYQTLFVKYQALFNEVYPRLIDCFNNETGDDFRDWLIDRKGGDLWAAFKKDATPELLTQMTQAHPGLKPQWQPEDKVLIFFSQMMDDEEEDDDVEEPPVIKQPEVVK
jgi:hypothetical protein